MSGVAGGVLQNWAEAMLLDQAAATKEDMKSIYTMLGACEANTAG